MPASATHLLSDRSLVANAQAGDLNALNSLMSAVSPAVVKYCRYRLASYAGGVDAADDVAQETCVALVRVLPTYQDQGAPFAALVYAIASNKVADAQRRFSRAAILVEEFPEQTEPSMNPEEHAIAQVDVRAAREMLAKLAPRMRELLTLRASGLSAEAIGLQLGMKPNAVRVAQHRAGIKLRQLIEESEEHREIFSHHRNAG